MLLDDPRQGSIPSSTPTLASIEVSTSVQPTLLEEDMDTLAPRADDGVVEDEAVIVPQGKGINIEEEEDRWMDEQNNQDLLAGEDNALFTITFDMRLEDVAMERPIVNIPFEDTLAASAAKMPVGRPRKDRPKE
eukprot:TRINITY_DN3057_c0_g1_i2.p2 TRINITY_DN3057_c0_g1~~TRINITY_DN3057_c0_g1_i2.p2  ORF type:complete len:134 (+),score=23.26 TRINITY_DN3057_c0_g1_i2:802-1203(+)